MKLAAIFPQPSSRRIAVHPRPAAVREIAGGHPWLWSGSVQRRSHVGQPGDLAAIFDRNRRFVAIGLYDPDAPIEVRVLHRGEPRTIDADFFLERLVEAIDRRRRLADDPETTGYRLVHGENDSLPGLVVDRYAEVLVVRLDTAAWLAHLATIVPQLVELIEPTTVVLRTSRSVRDRLPAGIGDGMTLHGPDPSESVRFFESGMEMSADVVTGQKTGHFCDQRDNRRLVAHRCRDANVLDVFCNTGGFSVAAAAAGARSVTSIDIAPGAITATIRHMELNRARLGFTGTHQAQAEEAFDAMNRLADDRACFDVVIIDPPSFAPNQASVAPARRAYRRLCALGIELLGSGGTLFQASCSSRIDEVDFYDLIADEVDRAGLVATNMIRTGHGLDHPVDFPEGAYLKAVVADLVSPRI